MTLLCRLGFHSWGAPYRAVLYFTYKGEVIGQRLRTVKVCQRPDCDRWEEVS